jgi:DNA-binding PadR family transcriptional regulator
MAGVRITVGVARVLRVFLENPAQPHYGYELMQATGFPSGKLYPMLAKLQAGGWLTKEREDIDPSVVGRPPRRLYRLSPEGTRAAREELAALSAELRPPLVAEAHRVLRPEGGLS